MPQAAPVFSAEELALMSFYNTESREALLNELSAIEPYIEEEIAAAYAVDILAKLSAMTDEQFSRLKIINCFEDHPPKPHP